MLCGWSGIANVGLAAVNTMRRLMRAEEFGQIEPLGYFDPTQVVIANGLIEDLRFPTTRLFSHRRQDRDLVFVIGEQQPEDPEKAYEMAGEVLDVAQNRDLEAVCLLGEVPYYLQGAPWPYPKASIAVLEVLGSLLRVPLDLSGLHDSAARVEANIDQVLETLAGAEELPERVREEMDSLRHPHHVDLGPITEAEKHEMLDHLDELFRGEVGNES